MKILIIISCVLFLLIILILMYAGMKKKKYVYELDRKPSKSLYSKNKIENFSHGKDVIGSMDTLNNNSEIITTNNDIEDQYTIDICNGGGDMDNSTEFEEDLIELYRDENLNEYYFMTNLCDKIEHDLSEKIKQGKCILFKKPIRTKVIQPYIPSSDKTDELTLKLDDVVLLTKIFDDGWVFGSRVKGRFREGAFPIHCLENKCELYKILPKKNYENRDFESITRFSSVRNKIDNTYQYYYHPVIKIMKYINSVKNNINNKNTNNKNNYRNILDNKIYDIDKINYENNINNDYIKKNKNETSSEPVSDITENNRDDSIIIPELPKQPMSNTSYEERVQSLRRSLERRHKNQQEQLKATF